MLLGGVSAFYWANFIGNYLGNKIKYSVIPDSGIFLDYTHPVLKISVLEFIWN